MTTMCGRGGGIFMRVCVCVCVCMRACVRMHAGVCVHASVYESITKEKYKLTLDNFHNTFS